MFEPMTHAKECDCEFCQIHRLTNHVETLGRSLKVQCDHAAELEKENAAWQTRVAELESAIVCGFKGWSEGGIYAEVVIDADFFETLKPQP